jgi:hypothetical protein
MRLAGGSVSRRTASGYRFSAKEADMNYERTRIDTAGSPSVPECSTDDSRGKKTYNSPSAIELGDIAGLTAYSVSVSAT